MCANNLKRNIFEMLRTVDVKTLTIGEVIALKSILGLTDSEAINIFLGV